MIEREKTREAPWPKRCAWCNKDILVGDKWFLLRVNAGIYKGLLNEWEGEKLLLDFPLTKRTVEAAVPREGSTEKNEGADLLFAICRKGHGKKLEKVLQEEGAILLKQES